MWPSQMAFQSRDRSGGVTPTSNQVSTLRPNDLGLPIRMLERAVQLSRMPMTLPSHLFLVDS